MAALAKTTHSMSEMEEHYTLVTRIYDLADQLLSTVESPFVRDPEAQMNLVEPVINEIGDATDILAEEFIAIAEGNRSGSKKANKARIENAFRKMFNALNDYQERVKASSKRVHAMLKNIADPIIRRIQLHIEEVVVMFLQFVQISLASIMHKQQLEAIRVRDPRIALMMHQYAMMSQQ